MPEPKLATVTKDREVRTHAYLLHTSSCLLKKGQEQEAGSFHQFMGSLVFAAFTLEAYLNWLGDKLFPHWTYLERLSPKEKLELISDQLKMNVENGKRPWQTLIRLFKFRNDIAHAKREKNVVTETVEPIDEHLNEKLGKRDNTEIERFCTRENAERALEDIRQILEILHAAADLKDDLGPFSRGIQLHTAAAIGPP